MTWLYPTLLWLLLLPAGGLLADLRARRRDAAATHPRIVRAEAGSDGLTLLDPARRDPARRRRRWRLWLGLGLALAALARPQWGEIDQPVFEQSREIIIALDLSRSMLAEDVRPNRLERARLLTASLLERLEGERVGLVVFAGTAFLQSPLSGDYEILREFLPALGPDYLPTGGSNYHALLTASLEAFGPGSEADRFLIILSDGEAQDDTWRPLVPRLAERGIRVLGLGIGTGAGGMLPDGAGGFIKDERGAVVLSRLEPATLQELAQLTGGVYREASGWVDLASLLRATVEAGRAGEFTAAGRAQRIDRFQWLLAPALVLLAWSLWRELPVPVRPRPLRPARAPLGVLTALTLAALLGAPAPASATGPAPDAAASLTATVAQLSALPTLDAQQLGTLAEQTLAYGHAAKEAGDTPQAGPIYDALRAVTRGEALDARARDWPRLREELEALLDEAPPPEPQPDESESPDDESDQDESAEDQDQEQGGEGSPQDGEGEGDGDSSSEAPPGEGDPSHDEAGEGDDAADAPPPAGPEAFGDMQSEPEPRDESPPGQDAPTQTVGGQPDRAPATDDPALTALLQKLEEVKQQDSPARLFQLLQDPRQAPPATPGRNW